MDLLISSLLVILSQLSNNSAEMKGLLISGGDGSGAGTSVEVYDPLTGLSCLLPSLPDARIYHTMNNLFICGGTYTKDTCITLVSDQWEVSHDLEHQRMVHSSWWVGEKIILMGGGNMPTTSEVIPLDGGEGGEGWNMHYDTRNACSMTDLTSESVILTGGYKTRDKVTRYDMQGFVEELPSLLVGRYKHGCGAYLREDGSQVLLVTGGNNFGFINDHEASTEILTEGSQSWTLANPLPRGLIGISGANLDGRLFMTGGYTQDNDVVDDILGWSDEELGWEVVGKMAVPRGIHATSIIDLDSEAIQHCT